MKYFIGLVLAYLLGGIPWAYIIVKKTQGVDIRDFGSGNVGFTNATRILGKGPASLVLIGDVGKGVCAVLIGRWLGGPGLATLAGLAAVAGHNFPAFLHFKGGKGAATGFGALLALLPVVAVIAVIIWISTIALTRYVSLGTIMAAITVPVASLLLHVQLPYFLFGLVGASFVIFRHRTNISRLLKGTESKWGQKAK